MANVEHSTLTTTNLHENKGVSTASNNTVATASGGTTVWQLLTASNLTGTGNPFGAQLMYVRDEKASGTFGGTFTSGAWRTRTLNTSMTLEITGSLFSANQITLPAGTYFIHARAPASQVDAHTVKWRNVTDGTDTLIGSVANSNSGAPYAQTDSFVTGRFTIAGAKVFELQHRCGTTLATAGFGRPATFGVNEVYAEVMIWKVG